MAPYLCILAMEVFSGLLKRKTSAADFRHHWGYRSSSLAHLFFGDDVLLFAYADAKSSAILKSVVDEFSLMSGLKPNMPMSEIFIAGVDDDEKIYLQGQWGFNIGKLLFKYLGVPIVSTRFKYVHCRSFIDKVRAKAMGCSNNCLSYAGCLIFVKSGL